MKNTIFTSLFWNLAQKIGTSGIQFVVQIILARLLLPNDYGIIAIVNVFILFANILIHNGLTTALVQKKDSDALDFSTVFIANLILSLFLYISLFMISPYLARFFNMSNLTRVIRILSLIVLIAAVSSVQEAYIQKHMLFKRYFVSSLVGIIISGTVGIILAYMGMGVWSLVLQQIINQLLLSLVLFFQIEWKPTFMFSFKRFKSLYSFGWRVLVSSIVTTLYTDIRTLVIGIFHSASGLGFYNRGQLFPRTVTNNIVSSIRSVLFPTFSLHQDNLQTIKSMMKRSISVGLYIIAPMMIGMMVVAENLVVVLLTDTWIQAVPFLQIYCVVYLFRPIFATNLQSINGIGRSDIFMRMEVLKSLADTVVLIITVPFGIYAIAFGSIVSSFLALFIYTYPNKKIIDFGLNEQLKISIAPLFASIVMGIVVNLLNYLNINRLPILILQVLLGLITYVLLSIFFKLDSFYYLLDIVKNLLTSKQDKKNKLL